MFEREATVDSDRDDVLDIDESATRLLRRFICHLGVLEDQDRKRAEWHPAVCRALLVRYLRRQFQSTRLVSVPTLLCQCPGGTAPALTRANADIVEAVLNGVVDDEPWWTRPDVVCPETFRRLREYSPPCALLSHVFWGDRGLATYRS